MPFSSMSSHDSLQLVDERPMHAGPTGLCLEKITRCSPAEGRLFVTLLVGLPFSFLPPLPSVPPKPLFFQSRGKGL